MAKNKLIYIPQREELPTAIAIYGITDKHTGKKPQIIKFNDVPDLYKGLQKYLPKKAIPTYEWVLKKIISEGYLQLMKLERSKGKYQYAL